MSFPTRSLSTHMRAASASASQSPALAARIEEKKAELEHLRELRDLSAAVAGQMEALEHKLQTLSGGTQGTAGRPAGVVSRRADGVDASHRSRHGQLAQRAAGHQHGLGYVAVVLATARGAC